MFDETKATKNYGDYDGNDWWVEGKLHVTGDIEIAGTKFGPAANVAADANVVTLIAALKVAGLIEGDDWVVDASAVGTPSAMPTPETISNTGHISEIDYEDHTITLTLDCKIADLEDADHGTAWGVHKWLGFAVETGISPITGIVFTDATGATATLGADDIAEATTLGIDAGGFVLYIKADDLRYANGGRKFTLAYPTYKTEEFKVVLVEAEEDT